MTEVKDEDFLNVKKFSLEQYTLSSTGLVASFVHFLNKLNMWTGLQAPSS